MPRAFILFNPPSGTRQAWRAESLARRLTGFKRDALIATVPTDSLPEALLQAVHKGLERGIREFCIVAPHPLDPLLAREKIPEALRAVRERYQDLDFCYL